MRDYLARLKARGDLIVIDREVDPVHELAAVAVQLQRKSGKAVLFNKVRGSDMPVAINVYSNHDRLCEIIRCGDRNFCERLDEQIHEAAGNAAWQRDAGPQEWREGARAS